MNELRFRAGTSHQIPGPRTPSRRLVASPGPAIAVCCGLAITEHLSVSSGHAIAVSLADVTDFLVSAGAHTRVAVTGSPPPVGWDRGSLGFHGWRRRGPLSPCPPGREPVVAGTAAALTALRSQIGQPHIGDDHRGTVRCRTAYLVGHDASLAEPLDMFRGLGVRVVVIANPRFVSRELLGLTGHVLANFVDLGSIV